MFLFETVTYGLTLGKRSELVRIWKKFTILKIYNCFLRNEEETCFGLLLGYVCLEMRCQYEWGLKKRYTIEYCKAVPFINVPVLVKLYLEHVLVKNDDVI